jgi:D-alanyl-D-alanine carboxypeptidase/D-alanyl-D-alanine-endopeptidase (penicillin-binding protein 4)
LTFDLVGCAKAPATLSPPRLDPLQQLTQDIAAATMAPGVQRAAWGIVVHSLDRHERIFELNPRTLLVPASAAKLVSLATAVDAVGWNFRFETTVHATAPLVDGTLQGDLLIGGSGDPSIGGRAGEELSVWVDALKGLGLRRVDGRVIGDDDASEEPRPQLAWAWDDLGYATGVLFGALNLAENRMVVTVTPGAAPDGPTSLSVDPHASYRPLTNRTVTGAPGSSLLIWPEQRPGEPFLTIAGSVPAGAPPAQLSVSAGNPTFWFATVLRNALLGSGIEVTGEAFDIDEAMPRPERAGPVLYTYRSPTLAEIAQPLLKDSINLYGEAVLRLNAERSVLATNDAALEGVRMRLAAWGIPRDSWQIVDGSGLSRRNAVAPEALVAILERMYDASWASPWMTGLPIAGRDGTLAGRMKGTPAEDNVRAKTGTMSNIRTLAGYVRTRDGEALAFAVMADSFEGPGSAATEAIDRIAVRLAGFSRDPRLTTAAPTGHLTSPRLRRASGDTEAQSFRVLGSPAP